MEEKVQEVEMGGQGNRRDEGIRVSGVQAPEEWKQEAQVRERERKAAGAMREVWGMGKGSSGATGGGGSWLFDTLV